MHDGKANRINEREEEATNSQTLDELEDQEQVGKEQNRSPVISPDEGSDRRSSHDDGQPM